MSEILDWIDNYWMKERTNESCECFEMKSNVKWSTFLTLFDFWRKIDVTFQLKFIFVTTKVIPFLVEVTRFLKK